MDQLPEDQNKLDKSEKKVTSSSFSNRFKESLLIQLIKQSISSYLRKPSWKSLSLLVILSTLAVLFKEQIPGENDGPYREIRIDIQVACEHPLFIGERFKNFEVEAFEEERNDVWPVFRWKCRYIGDNGIQVIRGLDLDKYCFELTLTEEEYYKAYPKNYEDKNSWHCTYVGSK